MPTYIAAAAVTERQEGQQSPPTGVCGRDIKGRLSVASVNRFSSMSCKKSIPGKYEAGKMTDAVEAIFTPFICFFAG